MTKHRTGGAAAASAAAPDLKTLIHENSLFFDRLIDLIPSRFYLPAPDEDRTPFKFLSKPDKAAARKATRRNLKAARRTRLDPEKPSNTLHLLHQSIEADAPTPDADGDTDTVLPDDRSVTYEELRQRLHRRIEELRSTRNTRPEHNYKPVQREKEKDKKNKYKKTSDNGEPPKRKHEGDECDEKAKAVETPAADLTFGQVKIGGEDADGRRKKKQKLSKAQELERAKRLEELKKDPEKGEKVAKKHSWKAAESRAMGVKVHDDPKLLKESIKKERKRQQKHAEQWKERTESRGKERAEKQKTRTDNIRERIQQKKSRKIEKREKKLMRPGFEGRKEGYVNK